MSLLSPDKESAFVHVPKTGGTSIESQLKAMGWNGLKRPPYNKIHHVGFDYIRRHCDTVKDAVAIVRNPVDYAISFYRHWLHRQRENVRKSTYSKAGKHLEMMEQGFMTWFFDHAPRVDRWQGILESQRGIIGQPGLPFDHTRVFDYENRSQFWMYIIGHVPPTEPRIHRLDDVEPYTVEGEDRKKIQNYYRLDMETWADQFKWC
jgi:hypothetical protein